MSLTKIQGVFEVSLGTQLQLFLSQSRAEKAGVLTTKF